MFSRFQNWVKIADVDGRRVEFNVCGNAQKQIDQIELLRHCVIACFKNKLTRDTGEWKVVESRMSVNILSSSWHQARQQRFVIATFLRRSCTTSTHSENTAKNGAAIGGGHQLTCQDTVLSKSSCWRYLGIHRRRVTCDQRRSSRCCQCWLLAPASAWCFGVDLAQRVQKFCRE